MSTLGWLFNFLPWWTTYAIGGAVLIFTVPYWLPIWRSLPRPVQMVFGGGAALVAAWWAGRNQGARSERDMQKQRDTRARETRKDVNREVESLDRNRVDQRLGKWMRRDE